MARVRQALLIAQLGCCCALVISAGLIVERLKSARKTTVAHGLGNAVLATVNAHPNVGLAYFAEIERVATSERPQLDALAWTATLPGTRPTWRSYRAEPPGLEWRTVPLHAAVLTNEVLTQLSLPPREGRLFGLADRGCLVAVANEQAGGCAVRREYRRSNGGGSVRSARDNHRRRWRERRPWTRQTCRRGSSIRPSKRCSPQPSPRARFRAAVTTPLQSIDLDTRVVSEAYFDAMGATLSPAS